MRIWTLVIAMLLVAAAPAVAGKRKGAVTARIEYGTVTRLKGLAITVAPGSHSYLLTVQKGKRKVEVETDGETPWFEVVAFGKLVQVAGGPDDARLTIAPGTKIAKRGISAEKAMALVQAEADRRDIPYSEAGAEDGSGVFFVGLASGKNTVVTAVVGARSRDFLGFEELPRMKEPAGNTAAAAPADFQAILDEHNRVRADHCAPALTWSDKLAAAAQTWADHLRDDGCGFEHSSTDYGENLAAGTTGTLSPKDVVAMWYDEINAYDFKKGGFSMDTGHFTQVIWQDTTQVGCGVSQCNGLDIWVCNYDPPGNVDGEYKQNVLPTTCR